MGSHDSRSVGAVTGTRWTRTDTLPVGHKQRRPEQAESLPSRRNAESLIVSLTLKPHTLTAVVSLTFFQETDMFENLPESSAGY